MSEYPATCYWTPCRTNYRVFSHDVTAAIFVSQNNETAAMLVSLTNPVGVELFSNANAFFCSNNLHRCWPREWKHSINGTNKCINTIIFGPDANYWPGISRWPPIHTSGADPDAPQRNRTTEELLILTAIFTVFNINSSTSKMFYFLYLY